MKGKIIGLFSVFLLIIFISELIAQVRPCNINFPTTRGARTSSPFGPRWGGTHQGTDYAVPIGSPVYAAYDGTVGRRGWQNEYNHNEGYGQRIYINHGDGVETIYGHLNEINVRSGQQVRRGDLIGRSGNTGLSTGPHLHFGISVNGVWQNPQDWTTETHKEENAENDREGDEGEESEIITARDPNAMYGKQGMVSAGETLEYTIEFENEGEGIAYGVYITDKLDEDFDDSTLQIVSFERVDWQNTISTQANFEYRYSPDTRLLTIFIDNGGEVLSKYGGRIKYSIKVKDNAPAGTAITNYATVYFPSVPEITPTNAIVSIVPHQTRIDYMGDTMVYQGQIPEIKAKLRTEEGNIIPYQQILFKINNEVYTSTTQVDGVAREYPTITSPGTYTIDMEFQGDGFYNLPSSGEGKLQVLPPPPISYLEIIAPKTTTTYCLFELNVTARDEQGNIATTTAQATITNTTNSISPATITLTNGSWEGLAAIATSPDGGVDTITVTSGIITGIATITVYLTPGQTQTITSHLGTITLLETESLTEAFFVSIKDASNYSTFTTTHKPSGDIGLCIDVNLTGVSENEVKGSVTLFVAVPYLEANLGKIKESTLKLYTFNEQTKIWEQVSGSWVDTPNNIVSGTLTHLSLIAPLGVISFAENNNNAFAYPNPWRKNKDERYIYFGNISEDSVIRIYNIVGELIDEVEVKEYPQRWDVVSKDIASDIYLYTVTGGKGGKKVGKIGIIK
ncbi:MAG: peptidoglycan DD-metalloendopeptidase family protein [bacterium]